MALPVLTIGDSFRNTGTLWVQDTNYPNDPTKKVVYNASNADSIKAVIISLDYSTAYCDVVTLDKNAVGADWSVGEIVYNFTPAITADIADVVTRRIKALIETQVEEGGEEETWYDEIEIRPGHIS